jgi:alpha-glucosidase (family GH31 glycosyl hydrolase)
MRVNYAASSAALLVAVATKTQAAALNTQLDAFGANSIRVRIAAPNQPITEPVISALLPTAPAPGGASDGSTVTNGNLLVSVDPATHFITATRVSDGKVLLQQTGLDFSQACNGSRAGSVAVTVTFAGRKGERVYGLGEHSTGKVQQSPYQKVFSDSLYYPVSRGSDVSIPYYSSNVG